MEAQLLERLLALLPDAVNANGALREAERERVRAAPTCSPTLPWRRAVL